MKKKKKWDLPAEVRRTKEEIDAFVSRVLESLGPEDHAIAVAFVETVRHLLAILSDKNLSLKLLQRLLLFGSTSEKMSEVLEAETSTKDEPAGSQPEAKRKGHGRNGASKYPGARRVRVEHATLRSGDACPGCDHGKVYDTGRPGIEPRIVGRPPLEATIWEQAKLRCNLCGEVFTAELPPEAGLKKYDETAASMIVLLKYGTGMPFYRCLRARSGRSWRRLRKRARRPTRSSSARRPGATSSTTTTRR
jgi:transposase